MFVNQLFLGREILYQDGHKVCTESKEILETIEICEQR